MKSIQGGCFSCFTTILLSVIWSELNLLFTQHRLQEGHLWAPPTQRWVECTDDRRWPDQSPLFNYVGDKWQRRLASATEQMIPEMAAGERAVIHINKPWIIKLPVVLHESKLGLVLRDGGPCSCKKKDPSKNLSCWSWRGQQNPKHWEAKKIKTKKHNKNTKKNLIKDKCWGLKWESLVKKAE